MGKLLPRSYFFFRNDHNLSFLLLTLAVWWSGIAGRDLYLLPGLAFITLLGINAYRNEPVHGQFDDLSTRFFSHRFVLGFLVFQGFIFFIFTILKYYSFSWNAWDVGNHSNMLYNISQGEFYSSILGVHNLADHFSVSMSPLALLYMLEPSTHWMTLAKTTAYISVPIFLYRIRMQTGIKPGTAIRDTALISCAWLLFYAPALNSLYYEFQPSSLALPFVLYAFLCLQREHWIRFGLTMVFLLGFKEHLGSVWIGLGIYLMLSTPRKKLGLFLVAAGALVVYLVMFQVMQYFRNYEASWSMGVAPFEDIPKKLVYLFKLLAPLGFLPLIHWRLGILAAPAVGVNLLSGPERNMYSTSFHYDDVPSTLLMLTMVLILTQVKKIIPEWLGGLRMKRWVLTGWASATLLLLPKSPLRVMWENLPTREHSAIRGELVRLDRQTQGKAIAVQTSLVPQLNRRELTAITQGQDGNCISKTRNPVAHKPQFLVLSPDLNHYLIENLDDCLRQFNSDPGLLKLKEYESLEVFMVLTPEGVE